MRGRERRRSTSAWEPVRRRLARAQPGGGAMEDAMRREHRTGLAALAIVVALAGCGAADRGGDAPAAPPPRPPRAVALAPADPDLASVMERFYQHVEGAHWAFAYGML